ncbi:MAG: hypothetical protein WC856_07995 [Methylococcaceae bacterium]
MSITIETIIGCDGGKDCPTGGCYLDGNMRSDTAKAQRSSYGNDVSSWVFHEGKDYCPDCAKRLGIRKRRYNASYTTFVV